MHFRLVEATQEPGNNKEPDDAKRRYILASANPISVENSAKTLTLRFEFRAPTPADGKRVEDSEATRIYGGKFDKSSGRSKGDCLLYTSPSPRDVEESRMPSSA